MVFPTGLVKEGRSLRIVGFFESRGWIESVLPSKGANVSEQRWQKFFFDTRFSSPYLGSKLSLASLSNRSLSFYELRIVGLCSLSLSPPVRITHPRWRVSKVFATYPIIRRPSISSRGEPVASSPRLRLLLNRFIMYGWTSRGKIGFPELRILIISSNLCHGSWQKKEKVSRWRLVNLPPLIWPPFLPFSITQDISLSRNYSRSCVYNNSLGSLRNIG